MKTSIKITFILIFLIFIKASSQINDTLAYVKSFEANKTQYLGQPFSKLLNEMVQLQPKTLWSTNTRYSTLNFCNKENSFNLGTINMIIYWQLPISELETEYYENKNHFYFTTDERNFYGSKIVKDIYVYTTK